MWQSNNQTAAVGLGYSSGVNDGGCALTQGNQFYQIQSGVLKSAPLTIECLVMPTNRFGGGGWAIGTGLPLLGQTAAGLPNAVDLAGTAFNGAVALSFWQWHQLALVMTTTAATLYVDGASVAVHTAGQPNTTSNWEIGSDGTNGWPGFVSEVAVYSSALSAARMAAHFAAIDNANQVPVAAAAGGTGGGGTSVTNPNYLSILQQILQSVRKQF